MCLSWTMFLKLILYNMGPNFEQDNQGLIKDNEWVYYNFV